MVTMKQGETFLLIEEKKNNLKYFKVCSNITAY